MLLVNFIILFLFTAMAIPVYAAQVCRAELGPDRFDIIMAQGEGRHSSQVIKNGVNMPQLGQCQESNRPSTRHLRCTHTDGEIRVEIYLWKASPNGPLKGPGAIVWRNNEPYTLSLDCE